MMFQNEIARKTKIDPTGTLTKRKDFDAQIRKRYRCVKGAVNRAGAENRFGFNDTGFRNQSNPFASPERKNAAYESWLEERLRLDVEGAPQESWTAEYVDHAYKKGMSDAFDEYARFKDDDEEPLNKALLIAAGLDGALSLSEQRLLQEKLSSGLQRINKDVSTRNHAETSDLILQGSSSRQIAANTNKIIDTVGINRGTLLTTEIVRAYTYGTLFMFGLLGVENVQVLAEWKTAGDSRVCDKCHPMEGRIFTLREAKGLIPRHPRCRCRFVLSDPTKTPLDYTAKSRNAMKKSLRAESPKEKTLKEMLEKSVWLDLDAL